jgi:hypothetical protein
MDLFHAPCAFCILHRNLLTWCSRDVAFPVDSQQRARRHSRGPIKMRPCRVANHLYRFWEGKRALVRKFSGRRDNSICEHFRLTGTVLDRWKYLLTNPILPVYCFRFGTPNAVNLIEKRPFVDYQRGRFIEALTPVNIVSCVAGGV